MSIDDYEPLWTVATSPGDHTAPQVLEALGRLHDLRARLAEWEPRLIETARDLGTSWQDLAPVLGVASRQAAERRFLRLRTSELTDSTGEQRVQAERDRRAGDRAVSQWARDNSAELRGLAGRIGDLDTSVHLALGEDDAAALLSPLAGAHDHLRATHPDLADHIGAIGEHTDRVRRDVQAQRTERTQP
jgi:hypothetical protein